MLLHVQRLLRRFEGLRGAEVISWKGVEMAFTEGREGGEFWDDKSVPIRVKLSTQPLYF